MIDDEDQRSERPDDDSDSPDQQQEPYEVGYGKPPVEHRFAKGASGNRKGRPKSARSFRTEILEVLTSKVTIKEGGKSRKISTSMATLQRLRQRALSGDFKAMDKLLLLALQYLPDGEGPKLKTLLQEDEALLKQYRRQIKEESNGDGD